MATKVFKCPHCDGTGVMTERNDKNEMIMKRQCPYCDGSGKDFYTYQTNEEWFCGLSTEEKAEFFHKQMVTGYYLWTDENDLPRKEHWVKWLKEKHK